MDEAKRKLALIYDKYFQKDLADKLSREFSKFCDFRSFSVDDKLNEIHKFKPEFIFYLRNLRSDIHRVLFVKDKDYKCRTVCWILDDPSNLYETLDICIFYDYVFTIDSLAMKERQELKYTNIYYLPLDTNDCVQKIISIICQEKK